MEQETCLKSDIEDLKGIIDRGILKGGKGIESRGKMVALTQEEGDFVHKD